MQAKGELQKWGFSFIRIMRKRKSRQIPGGKDSKRTIKSQKMTARKGKPSKAGG